MELNNWKTKNNPQIRIILNPDKHDKTIPEIAANFEW